MYIVFKVNIFNFNYGVYMHNLKDNKRYDRIFDNLVGIRNKINEYGNISIKEWFVSCIDIWYDSQALKSRSIFAHSTLKTI